VIAYLAGRGADVVVLARNPAKAEELRGLGRMKIQSLGEAAEAFEGAAAIVNATSLGMAGADPMPRPLLDAVRENSGGALLFDIVTTPPETEFLACGDRTADGLTMLIGQARRAFEFFFGQKPPQRDEDLRRLLTGASK
jgi:shikimate dehydrogenase